MGALLHGVSWEMLRSWVGSKGVMLAAQGDTLRVVRTLRPLVVVMAGENELDPYKD